MQTAGPIPDAVGAIDEQKLVGAQRSRDARGDVFAGQVERLAGRRENQSGDKTTTIESLASVRRSASASIPRTAPVCWKSSTMKTFAIGFASSRTKTESVGVTLRRASGRPPSAGPPESNWEQDRSRPAGWWPDHGG